VAAPAGVATRRRLAGVVHPLVLAGGAAAAFAVVALVDPNQPGHYPVCPFLLVTGHFCPGCGSLRAMHALSRGDLPAALGLNVLTVLALPLLAYWWLRWLGRSVTGAPRPAPRHPALVWGLLALVAVFWLVRNLPVGSALAP
jgi:hypothetical protein